MSTWPTKLLSCQFFLLTLVCPPPPLHSFHRATHPAVSAPSAQSEVLRIRAYGPSREQPSLSRHRTTHRETEIMLTIFNTALRGSDTLQRADHAGPGEGLLCLWTVVVERRRKRRGTKTKLWGEHRGGGGGTVMTATHRRLPDISHTHTLCPNAFVQLAEPAWIVPAFSLNTCQKDLNETEWFH